MERGKERAREIKHKRVGRQNTIHERYMIEERETEKEKKDGQKMEGA